MNRLQQIYDFVCRHLLTQNRRAFGSDGKCKYLTDDGLKCAAGCLFIGHDPSMENVTFYRFDSSMLQTAFGVHAASLTDDEDDLISSLQRVHDALTEFGWPKALVKLAERYELTPFTHDDLPGPRGRVNPFANQQ